MSAMKIPSQNDYPIYRCPSTSDCSRHLTISAEIAEQVVTEAAQAAIADIHGKADGKAPRREAEAALATAEGALEAAVVAFDGLGDMQAAKDKLGQLRAAVDAARERLAQLGPADVVLRVNGAEEWDQLSAEEKRALIRATIKTATVAPGRGGAGRGDERGAERITITTA